MPFLRPPPGFSLATAVSEAVDDLGLLAISTATKASLKRFGDRATRLIAQGGAKRLRAVLDEPAAKQAPLLSAPGLSSDLDDLLQRLEREPLDTAPVRDLARRIIATLGLVPPGGWDRLGPANQ